jgi:hypothetical protein
MPPSEAKGFPPGYGPPARELRAGFAVDTSALRIHLTGMGVLELIGGLVELLTVGAHLSTRATPRSPRERAFDALRFAGTPLGFEPAGSWAFARTRDGVKIELRPRADGSARLRGFFPPGARPAFEIEPRNSAANGPLEAALSSDFREVFAVRADDPAALAEVLDAAVERKLLAFATPPMLRAHDGKLDLYLGANRIGARVVSSAARVVTALLQHAPPRRPQGYR